MRSPVPRLWCSYDRPRDPASIEAAGFRGRRWSGGPAGSFGVDAGSRGRNAGRSAKCGWVEPSARARRRPSSASVAPRLRNGRRVTDPTPDPCEYRARARGGAEWPGIHGRGAGRGRRDPASPEGRLWHFGVGRAAGRSLRGPAARRAPESVDSVTPTEAQIDNFPVRIGSGCRALPFAPPPRPRRVVKPVSVPL